MAAGCRTTNTTWHPNRLASHPDENAAKGSSMRADLRRMRPIVKLVAYFAIRRRSPAPWLTRSSDIRWYRSANMSRNASMYSPSFLSVMYWNRCRIGARRTPGEPPGGCWGFIGSLTYTRPPLTSIILPTQLVPARGIPVTSTGDPATCKLLDRSPKSVQGLDDATSRYSQVDEERQVRAR